MSKQIPEETFNSPEHQRWAAERKQQDPLNPQPIDDALVEFTDYFVHNYPGPNTIITDPRWHAPRIFKAAEHALKVHRSEQLAYSRIIAVEAVKHAIAFYLAGGDDWRERAIHDVQSLILYPHTQNLDAEWSRCFAVVYSNYDPPEVNSLYATREKAEARVKELGDAWRVAEMGIK